VGKRHRRIRARSATGQVAGAATEKPGLKRPSSKNRPAQHAFSQKPLSRSPDPNPAPEPEQQPQAPFSCPEARASASEDRLGRRSCVGGKAAASPSVLPSMRRSGAVASRGGPTGSAPLRDIQHWQPYYSRRLYAKAGTGPPVVAGRRQGPRLRRASRSSLRTVARSRVRNARRSVGGFVSRAITGDEVSSACTSATSERNACARPAPGGTVRGASPPTTSTNRDTFVRNAATGSLPRRLGPCPQPGRRPAFVVETSAVGTCRTLNWPAGRRPAVVGCGAGKCGSQ